MVTKLKKNTPPPADNTPLGSSVKDSAQQIWQAGLGAFAKAQAEGTRAFEALVKEGTTLQRKTQAAAEEKITEATSRMSSMATDISSKASGHWDKLENIFEERVAKALNKLGVPSAKDISALITRIDELNASVQRSSLAQRPRQPPRQRPSRLHARPPPARRLPAPRRRSRLPPSARRPARRPDPHARTHGAMTGGDATQHARASVRPTL